MRNLVIIFLITLSSSFLQVNAMESCEKSVIPEKQVVIKIGSKNFEKFATAKKPFILDAWAEWCEPCKQMKPIFEEVAKDNLDYIFGSLDCKKEEELGKKLKIQCLPTFLVMKGNKEYGRILGAVPSAKDLLEKINECLSNKNPKEIGSDVGLSPQAALIRLGMLLQKKSEKDQIEELKNLFKEGLTTDMVLFEVPSKGNNPPGKMTVITMLLSANEALLRFLIDQELADVNKVSAEIDLNINKYNQELVKLKELKKILQTKV